MGGKAAACVEGLQPPPCSAAACVHVVLLHAIKNLKHPPGKSTNDSHA